MASCYFFRRVDNLISRDERKLFPSPLILLQAVKVKFLITKTNKNGMWNITTDDRVKKCQKTNKVDFNALCCFFAQYTKEIIYFLLTSVEMTEREKAKRNEISEAVLWRLISSHNIFCLTLEKFPFYCFAFMFFNVVGKETDAENLRWIGRYTIEVISFCFTFSLFPPNHQEKKIGVLFHSRI